MRAIFIGVCSFIFLSASSQNFPSSKNAVNFCELKLFETVSARLGFTITAESQAFFIEFRVKERGESIRFPVSGDTIELITILDTLHLIVTRKDTLGTFDGYDQNSNCMNWLFIATLTSANVNFFKTRIVHTIHLIPQDSRVHRIVLDNACRDIFRKRDIFSQ
jgi:hypothetical protein